LTVEEKETFQRLLGVTGIGTRGALSFLTQFTPPELAAAVAQRDAAALARVKGVGKTKAEKLVLELQGKLSHLLDGALPEAVARPAYGDDAAEALLSFGLTTAEVAAALVRVPPPGAATLEERIRLALGASDRFGG
jgi:Holliday junction DNA helicase RuvA